MGGSYSGGGILRGEDRIEFKKAMNELGMEGDIPSPIDPPSGCRFHTRCPYAKDICSQQVPQLKDVGNGHMTACHLYG